MSAGNAYLADFARRYANEAVINPTTVDSTTTHVPAAERNPGDRTITLGWTGTHSTLKYLDTLEPVWSALASRFGSGIRLVIIADRDPGLRWSQCTFIPWSKETEIADLRQIDIGLMPLTDDRWAQGKCGLKILQYMALAIPAVASPVGINQEIIRHGETGCLCATPEEWITTLTRLIEDGLWRERIGKAGREHVARHYSVDSNRSNFVGLFR